MRTLALVLALVVGACAGEEARLGLDQPLFVHNAELRDGKLPGAPGDAELDAKRAQVTSFSLGFGVLLPGTPNATVSGRTTANAYAVGLRFLDLGDGYWLLPAGAEDPTNPGELSFDFSFDAASALEPGLHPLAVVAFDERGKAGKQSVLSVCVASPVPDNLNACNPETAPPLAVASLTWSTDADLDLIVIAPDGAASTAAIACCSPRAASFRSRVSTWTARPAACWMAGAARTSCGTWHHSAAAGWCTPTSSTPAAIRQSASS